MAEGIDVLIYLNQRAREAQEKMSKLRRALSDMAVAMNEFSSGGGVTRALERVGLADSHDAKLAARYLDDDGAWARAALTDVEIALEGLRNNTRTLVNLAHEASRARK